MKLLIIDDEIDILELLRQECEELGYQVHTASNGEVAIQIAREQGPFDIVLTDLNMPRLNGVEFIAWLKEHSPSTSVMVMTASVNAFPGLDLKQVDQLIHKPFKFEQLSSTLKQLIQTRDSAQK